MEVLPEKITFASTQDEPHIGYFWRGGGVGREVVPSCPQISREIVCADLPISSIFRRPGTVRTVGGTPNTDPVAMRHSTFEYTLTPPPGLKKDQAVLTQHAELRPDPAQALPCII